MEIYTGQSLLELLLSIYSYHWQDLQSSHSILAGTQAARRQTWGAIKSHYTGTKLTGHLAQPAIQSQCADTKAARHQAWVAIHFKSTDTKSSKRHTWRHIQQHFTDTKSIRHDMPPKHSVPLFHSVLTRRRPGSRHDMAFRQSVLTTTQPYIDTVLHSVITCWHQGDGTSGNAWLSVSMCLHQVDQTQQLTDKRRIDQTHKSVQYSATIRKTQQKFMYLLVTAYLQTRHYTWETNSLFLLLLTNNEKFTLCYNEN